MPAFAAKVTNRHPLKLATLVCLCALPPALFGATEESRSATAASIIPELSAETQDFNIDTGETILRKATANMGEEGYLTGDEVSYNTKTGIVVAKGHVTLVWLETRMVAEEITFNLNDGTFTVRKPRIGSFPLYLSGSTATGTREQVVLSDAVASYGEPGFWVPSVKAKTITFRSSDKSFKATSADLGIAGAHFLPLPSFRQTAGISLKSYATIAGGYRSRLGAFLDTGLRAPVYPGLRVGADIGFYTSRGLLAGPAANYDLKTGSGGWVKGAIHTGYINDHGKREQDLLGKPVPEQRSFITWEHQQQVSEEVTIEGQFQDWRDSEVYRDFRRREFNRVQVPDNYIEATYTQPNFHVSAFGRFHPNYFHDTQERLPEVRLDVLPNTLFEKVYQRLNVSYARLRDNPPGDSLPTLETDRADAYYALTRNFTPREWLGATAVVGARTTHYTDALPGSGKGSYTRNLAEFGFDSHINFAGTFNYNNKRWDINGLRHLITPKVSYRYIPEAEKGTRYIPAIDRESFNTYLQPLGLGDIRHIDTLHGTNTLRLAVEQRLQTRDAQYGSRDLASLTLANDILFDRSDTQRKVAETHVDLGVMPARWLRFDAYTSFTPQSLHMREFNSALTIKDGEEWSLSLANHYLDGDIADYSALYNVRLNEAYSAYTRLIFDGRESRLNEHAYGFVHNLDRVWFFRYEVAFFNGPRREGDVEFRVEVDARGF